MKEESQIYEPYFNHIYDTVEYFSFLPRVYPNKMSGHSSDFRDTATLESLLVNMNLL